VEWQGTPEDSKYSEVGVKTLRPVDIAVGCFLALLGLFILYASSMIRVGVARALSPRTIPSAIGFLILFCGIGLAVKSWRFRGEDPKINWPDHEGIRIILVNLIFPGVLHRPDESARAAPQHVSVCHLFYLVSETVEMGHGDSDRTDLWDNLVLRVHPSAEALFPSGFLV